MKFFTRFLVSCVVVAILMCAVTYRTVRTLDYDFVFLADKVGDPPVMVMFQTDPDGSEATIRGWCKDEWPGGDHQWERPWNVAVLRAAKLGDIIRRYHDDTRFVVFGREVYRLHADRFMPERIRKTRQLYPEPRWPFTFENPRQAYWGLGEER